MEAALRRVRAGHDTSEVIDTNRRANAEGGVAAQVRDVLTNLAEACGDGKLSEAQMRRAHELVAVYKSDVRS